MNEILNTPVKWALKVLPSYLRTKLSKALISLHYNVQDIVLRCERPVCVYVGRKPMYLTKNDCLTEVLDSQELVIVSQQEVIECFNNVCGYSVYSHLNEIKEGYITIKGGHRVGITGTAVISSGSIHNVRDISTVSIRISRQVKDCAVSLTQEYIRNRGGLLICGSPCSGKTTLIRDMSRLLSTVYSSRTALIDTRGEIASVCQGIPQNDIGLCDVFDNYPRVDGITQAVRSLSPQHIICDEIGSAQDKDAIMQGTNSGVRFIATIHADNRKDLISRQFIGEILSTGAFEDIVFLSGRDNPCVIKEKYKAEELISD